MIYTDPGKNFGITADAQGILLCGFSEYISDSEDLEVFAKAVSDAFEEYIKMKYHIRSQIMAP